MRKILLIIHVLIFILAGSCQVNNKEPKAKFVFLFIGDGMGINQVYSAELYLAALQNSHGNTALSFSNFPVQSLVTTYSANSLTTCSSASGTALASGLKTNNGVLNKNPELTYYYETIAEKLKKEGFKIGILSSVGIDHATPAAFYAHQDSRNMYYNISMELPNSNFDYFGGGSFHYPKGRNDSMPDAIENATNKGYQYINTPEKFHALKKGDEKVFAVNPVIYPQGEFYWVIDKKENAITLADFTKKGIELIDNPKGFFMMIEGGKIDWACHGHDIASSIHETLAFSDAVAEAINFYKQHPDETLILITADHETGGLAVGNDETSLHLELLKHQNMSAQEFGRTLERFKSENPKASFKSVMNLVEMHFGLGNAEKNIPLLDTELALFKKAYDNTFVKNMDENPDKDYLAEDTELTITEVAIALMSKKAGIGWTTGGHSGTPVPIRALGSGQDYFNTYMDNTDIPRIIEKLMGI